MSIRIIVNEKYNIQCVDVEKQELSHINCRDVTGSNHCGEQLGYYFRI